MQCCLHSRLCPLCCGFHWRPRSCRLVLIASKYACVQHWPPERGCGSSQKITLLPSGSRNRLPLGGCDCPAPVAVRNGMGKGDPAPQHKHKSGCLRSYTAWFSTISISIKVCGKAFWGGGQTIRMGKKNSAEFLWLPFLSHAGGWCCPLPPIFVLSRGTRSKTKPENMQLLLLQQATREGLLSEV